MTKSAPYYIIPDIEALPEATGEERLRLCRRIAAVVGDPIALRTIIGSVPDEFAQFYPDMRKPDLSTSETIDSFLDKYGDSEAAAIPEAAAVGVSNEAAAVGVSEDADAAPVEEIPLPPPAFDILSIETSPVIEEEPAEGAADATASLLDSFFGETPANFGETPAKTPEPEAAPKKETPKLSESLARVMIKNGNYQKSLEIITDLSLNNPKKSVYFADQIRFLKKLILNQSKTR